MLEAACFGAVHYMVAINFQEKVGASVRLNHSKSTFFISFRTTRKGLCCHWKTSIVNSEFAPFPRNFRPSVSRVPILFLPKELLCRSTYTATHLIVPCSPISLWKNSSF